MLSSYLLPVALALCLHSGGRAFANTDTGTFYGWATVGLGTTGGAGGRVVKVTTPEGLVAHLERPEPLVLLVEGVIDFNTEFPGSRPVGRYAVASNKTIIGMGSDAEIRNGEFRLSGVENIIIRNLTFAQAQDTAVGIAHGSRRIWIDHNVFTQSNDGLIDITEESDYITVSWNRFFNQDKVSLVGASDDDITDRGFLRVTYHHNWFQGTNQRHPRVRFGRVHLFNNFYDQLDVGIGVGVEAQIISQHNYFSSNTPVGYYDEEYPEMPGYILDQNSLFVNGPPVLNPEGITWDPINHYSYTLLDAVDVPVVVTEGAGVGMVSHPPPPELAEPVGLIAYYPLTEGEGSVVTDQSGYGEPLNLNLHGDVYWLSETGGLRFDGGEEDRLQSTGPASKISQQIMNTGQFSIEVWARANSTLQEGPARLVSCSADQYHSNFMFGHGGDDDASRSLRLRLRSTGRGDENGWPSTEAPDMVINGVQQYACTYDGVTARFYHNGDLVFSETREGLLADWDLGYPLMIGNESLAPRGWRGEIRSVAVFDQSLSPEDIRGRFDVSRDQFIKTEITNFTEWLEQTFPTADLADSDIGGVDGDALGAGLPNLFRYALAVDPRTMDRNVATLGSWVNPQTGFEHLTLTFARRTDLQEVSFEVEASEDLEAWSRVDVGNTVATTNPAGDTETLTVRDPDPIGLNPRRFLRLRATLHSEEAARMEGNGRVTLKVEHSVPSLH